MANRNVLAIDLGASSGRGMIGSFDGKKISLSEIHRFSNDPVSVPGGFFWDTFRLLHEIKTAILNSVQSGGIETIGIDTWGVDYGYIDKTGTLLSTPYHYRDSRTETVPAEVDKVIPWAELYGVTGIQQMNFNTLYQIFSDLKTRPWLVENADKLLFTPDLLGYFLTGEKRSEYTIASTGAVLDAQKRDFAYPLLKKLGIREDLFCPITMPGSILGELSSAVNAETGNTGAKVVNIASHDTASAVLSVPAENEDFLYISSGTWSLMGIESKTPVISELSLKYGFTNEGGAFGTIRVLKNIMGLWLEQESRRQWKREGIQVSFDELSAMAKEAKPLQSIINPDDPMFSPAGDMPGRIRTYCKNTNQHVPENMGEIVRCIFESLALRYRWTAEKLESLTGRRYPVINIVGGGTKEEMLCQFAADASGRLVCAGPVEATALGNVGMQMIAAGEIGGLADARRIIRSSFEIKEYQPDTSSRSLWDDGYARFLHLIGEN